MIASLRLASVFLGLMLLGGCAGGSQSDAGLGVAGGKLVSVEPASSIEAGSLTPQSLLGVAPSALSARLGEPSFRRTEPGAEVWQYGGEACALFVYFYKTRSGALSSAYVDARRNAGGAADASSCLAEISAKHPRPVS